MKYLLLFSVFVFTSANAIGQSRILPPLTPRINPRGTCLLKGSNRIDIFTRNRFNIKAQSTVTSETARIADYVEFKTMENIYSAEEYPTVVFKEGTSIFAVVTWRKHRRFPLRGGKIEIALEPLVGWDGTTVEMGIRRHGRVRPEINEEKRRADPCYKALDKKNCVAGRRDPKVAPVVAVVAGSAVAAVGAFAEDKDLRFFAATTLFSMAKDLADLLNGTDAEIKQNEIFDLYIDPGSYVCSVPEKEKKTEPTRIEIVKPKERTK
jgi:hypothetical protein